MRTAHFDFKIVDKKTGNTTSLANKLHLDDNSRLTIDCGSFNVVIDNFEITDSATEIILDKIDEAIKSIESYL